MQQKSLLDFATTASYEHIENPWEMMRELQCSECTSCRRAEFRESDPSLKITVATGKMPADLMVVGKSPGIRDAREGIPFSFESGDMLKTMLEAIGLDWKKDVCLTNPVFCAMEEDKAPTKKEMMACAINMGQMVRTVKPKAFLALGNIAYQGLTGETRTMEELAGRTTPFPSKYDRPVWVVYHPAYLLRLRGQPEKLNAAKRACWTTLKALQATL